MKNQFYARLTPLISVALVLITFAGCSPTITNVDSEGNTTINKDALTTTINQVPVQPLSEIEKAGILFVREEEKLARDIYSELYKKWGINNFNNIGKSEQTHMDAMKSLIDRYSLKDPVDNKGTGVFTDGKLQKLYNDLIAQGSKSEIDALKVGAAIEEIDIIDIEEYVAKTTKQDIITVYQSLLKGSRNHLRSFVSVMEKRGVTYTPQYLTNKQFNEITGKPIEN